MRSAPDALPTASEIALASGSDFPKAARERLGRQPRRQCVGSPEWESIADHPQLGFQAGRRRRLAAGGGHGRKRARGSRPPFLRVGPPSGRLPQAPRDRRGPSRPSTVATAFGLVEQELSPVAIPEIVVSLGDRIPTVPRFLPRDPEGVKRIEACSARFDAILISGNGALTLGADLPQALLRMELVEHYAKILHAARALGSPSPLSSSEVEKLLEARKKAGLGPRK